MMHPFRRLKASLRSDRGDAILVMSVIFVPFFCLMAGMSIDLNKATWVKQQYQSIAQEATHNAARMTNTTGAIKEEATQAVVTSYIAKFNGGKGDTLGGTFGVRGSQCTTVMVNGVSRRAPYIMLTLDGGRNDATVPPLTYTSEGGAAPVKTIATPYNMAYKYYSLAAVVYDTAPNLMMGMFGKPCQQLTSRVASINFGSQEDLDKDNSAPTVTTPSEPDGFTCIYDGGRITNSLYATGVIYGLFYGEEFLDWSFEPFSDYSVPGNVADPGLLIVKAADADSVVSETNCVVAGQ